MIPKRADAPEGKSWCLAIEAGTDYPHHRGEWGNFYRTIRGRTVADSVESAPETKKDVVDISWIVRAKAIAGVPKHSQLVEIVSNLDQLIAARRTDLLSKALTQLVSTPGASLDVIVTALRGSFPARKQIPNWHQSVETARKRIAELGRNADTLLSGL